MQFTLYGLQPATTDAISATIVANVRARFHNRIEVATNKLITRLLYHIILNPLTAASANILDGSPLRWIGRIHKTHDVGGGNSSTMVGMFVCL